MTTISLLGAFAYCLTAALAILRASLTNRTSRRIRWSLVACIFILLAIWRFTEGEIWLQTLVRDWTRQHDLYDRRHDVQTPVTIALLVIITGIGWALFAARRGGNATRALIVAVLLLLVSVMRAVSLHMIDTIMYSEIGPLRVNYILDMGLTALAAAFAIIDRPPAAPSRTHVRSRRRSRRE